MSSQLQILAGTMADDATVKKCYNKHMKQCLTCKKEFIQKSNTRGLFCSRKCAGSFNAPIHKGKHYSTSTEFKNGHGKIGTYSTPKGIPSKKKGIPQLSTRGEKNCNWKGGVTSENEHIRKSIEYKLWSDSVFARDNFTDQKTGIRGGNLIAHHILNFAEYPELRLAIDNGITLSEKSHRAFHKKYGFRKNTMEQLTEFLTKII